MLNLLRCMVRGICYIVIVIAFLIDYTNVVLIISMWKFVNWVTSGIVGTMELRYPTMDEYYDYLFNRS